MRKASVDKGRSLTEVLASDRSRIIYSTSFRRLTQKAQVFSLETNASVRNRITHTFEVADVGRLISFLVTKQLLQEKKISNDLQLPFIYAVENACLLHDLGNPPFGHFGESAIRDWFLYNWEDIYKKAFNKEKITGDDDCKKLICDFLQYDGNPQGLRIILRLHRNVDKFSLNLTFTTILSFIKYVRSSAEKNDGELTKKAGYFLTEKHLIEKIKKKLEMPLKVRYPLAYIMEASDDIAFCMSDVEDGIEKKVLTEDDFFQGLKVEWKNIRHKNDSKIFPLVRELGNRNFINDREKFFVFKTSYSRELIKIAARNYIKYETEIMNGKLTSLFKSDTQVGRVLKCLKNVARNKLFRSPEAENPELAGYKIISGLLDAYAPILRCSYKTMQLLIKGLDNPKVLFNQNLDMQWRLINKLPKRHISAYKDMLKEKKDNRQPELYEWFYRCHLIVDFISGMTDAYALEIYQLLNGIRLR